MRQPHNNVAASKQWGCLTSLRLPHNNVAASQQWVCLTAMRLPHSNKAASQQWGCLTTMLMPNNSIATSQQCHCLTTMRLPPNEVSPWLWGLLFGLPHSNKFLTAFRAVARLVWSCQISCHNWLQKQAVRSKAVTWNRSYLVAPAPPATQ